MAKSIKVMIVDDSAVVRQVFMEIIDHDPNMELFAAASNPVFAMKRMTEKNARPDVIVLDVEMPQMNGLEFLRKIMSEDPIPVVMCSSYTERGAKTTVEAMSLGAVDFITKPKAGTKSYLMEESTVLVDTIKSAAKANVKKLKLNANLTSKAKFSAKATTQPIRKSIAKVSRNFQRSVVAIGASTGGTQALEVILRELPISCPGIIIVQHMPANFTRAFAERLNNICQIEVLEGQDGMNVQPGLAIIAPGGKHMTLKKNGSRYSVKVFDGPLVNRHKPSVDVLFQSVAKEAGSNALGIILTGMGDDGANGLREMFCNGAITIAQNERTSVVYGMPKEAVSRNAVTKVLPLQSMSNEIYSFVA